LAPFSKEQMGNLSPLGVSLKNCAISRQTFTSTFLQAAKAGPIQGIDLLKKFKVTVSPEINQIQFACSAAAPPAIFLPSVAPPAHTIFSVASSALPFLISSTPVPAPVPIPPPTAKTSSQPPAEYTYLVQIPKVKSSSFSSGKTSLPPVIKKFLIPCLMM
jgi:hypothetical protein